MLFDFLNKEGLAYLISKIPATAEEIGFDGSTSGSVAANSQQALDELFDRMNALNENVGARNIKTYTMSNLNMSTDNTLSEIMSVLPVNSEMQSSVGSGDAALNLSLPTRYAGLLILRKGGNNARGTAVFEDYQGKNRYVNYYYNSTWIEWERIPVNSDIAALSEATKSAQYGSCDNTDLNTIMSAGIYICSSNTKASLENNFPQVTKGYLIVYTRLGGQVTQIYYANKSYTFTRNYWDSAWSVWKKQATIDDIATLSGYDDTVTYADIPSMVLAVHALLKDQQSVCKNFRYSTNSSALVIGNRFNSVRGRYFALSRTNNEIYVYQIKDGTEYNMKRLASLEDLVDYVTIENAANTALNGQVDYIDMMTYSYNSNTNKITSVTTKIDSIASAIDLLNSNMQALASAINSINS